MRVAPEYTHKRNPDVVFVTDIEATSDGWTALVTTPPQQNVLPLEAVRQAGIAGLHLTQNVEMETAFIVDLFEFDLRAPADAPLQFTVTRLDRRSAQMDFDGYMTGRIHGRLLTPAQYRALRRHAPEPVERKGEVSIQYGQLTFGTDDPLHFDHPQDHVPGMVFVEALLQEFHGRSGRLRITFEAFAELGPAIEAHELSADHAAFFQRGTLVVAARIEPERTTF